jgi:hypothetical protein
MLVIQGGLFGIAHIKFDVVGAIEREKIGCHIGEFEG